MTEDSLVDVKTRIPKRAFQIIDQLVRKGYFSSMADFARQSILDKLINDFEIGVTELEPQIIDSKRSKKTRRFNQYKLRKGGLDRVKR